MPFDLTTSPEYLELVSEGVRKLAPIMCPTKVPMNAPGGPTLAPEWIVGQFQRLQMELLSLKLETMILNAVVAVHHDLGMASSEDEQIKNLLKVAKSRIDEFVNEGIQAHEEGKKQESNRIIRPNGAKL